MIIARIVELTPEQDGAAYDRWKAYGQSKTANMLFSVALAERLGDKGLRSFSLYPGRVLTGIVRSVEREELVGLGEYFTLHFP